jgi:ABC-type transporter Mla MlaB component
MALFNKPPAKKPGAQAIKPSAVEKLAAARTPISARDVAEQAQNRRGVSEKPRAEPVGDFSMTGASLIEWSPVRTSIEVAQSNPGMCAVLENAALLFASGQSQPARQLLEQGVQNDPEAKSSPLAWLALFDLLQRANDRAAFDGLALLYVVQFERSPPGWDEAAKQPVPVRDVKASSGGYAVITGKLTAASLPQIDALRRTMSKPGAQTRLDLAQVAGFDDAGAKLLVDALAEARKRRYSLKLERAEKVRNALDILVKRGRDAGEGCWLLSLELLQFEQKQEAFDDRAIEYAIAFEQSPPSWEPPPLPAPEADAAPEESHAEPAVVQSTSGPVIWSGVMSGPSTTAMARISEHAYTQQVIVIDMSDAERVDFVCAGALLNIINRVEAQRKAVQIVGASPIIRALLLLIGISPRHFLKKPQ